MKRRVYVAPSKKLESKRKKGLDEEKDGKTKDAENANTRGNKFVI